MELLKLLQMPPEELKSDVRKSFVDVKFIREILEWKKANVDEHPLQKLCLLLEVWCFLLAQEVLVFVFCNYLFFSF